MKKLIITTLILLAVAGINNLKAQCWNQITVSWTGDCVYPDDKTVYVVNLTIINECTTPSQEVYNQSQILTTNNTSYTFCIQNQLCTNDQKEPCFKVIATCRKLMIDTGELLCRDQKIEYKNCEELSDPFYLNLILE
ncbi:MAG TPA: hypothetical protein VK172_07465 [Lentimicrobium sp.]|nr:hypothetical protein [Lentimicrobium sp.]